MSSPGSNSRCECAPWRRTLRLLAIALLLVPGMSRGGLLNARIATFEACTEETVTTAGKLKALLGSPELYLTTFPPDRDSVDAAILGKAGITGFVASHPLYPNGRRLGNHQEVRFTGVVYKRKASIPERFLGAGEDRLFYGVAIDGESAVLDAGAFPSRPLAICQEAEQG